MPNIIDLSTNESYLEAVRLAELHPAISRLDAIAELSQLKLVLEVSKPAGYSRKVHSRQIREGTEWLVHVSSFTSTSFSPELAFGGLLHDVDHWFYSHPGRIVVDSLARDYPELDPTVNSDILTRRFFEEKDLSGRTLAEIVASANMDPEIAFKYIKKHSKDSAEYKQGFGIMAHPLLSPDKQIYLKTDGQNTDFFVAYNGFKHVAPFICVRENGPALDIACDTLPAKACPYDPETALVSMALLLPLTYAGLYYMYPSASSQRCFEKAIEIAIREDGISLGRVRNWVDRDAEQLLLSRENTFSRAFEHFALYWTQQYPEPGLIFGESPRVTRHLKDAIKYTVEEKFVRDFYSNFSSPTQKTILEEEIQNEFGVRVWIITAEDPMKRYKMPDVEIWAGNNYEGMLFERNGLSNVTETMRQNFSYVCLAVSRRTADQDRKLFEKIRGDIYKFMESKIEEKRSL